jgi:hypothetical protein
MQDHRRRTAASSALLAGLLSLPACDSGPEGGPRVPTYPIVGQVLVDGAPAENLQVVCHSTDGDAAVPISISAYTDAEGRFSVSTYEGGDGAPAGSYVLTFMWGQINLMSGRYGPPDKLNGKYADPETSDFTVEVADGVETDLGVIELTTAEGDSPS